MEIQRNINKAKEIENDILEEKTSFGGIIISGSCPENLQKKARKFSEEVSNGHHYMDLEVGFIRGYQSALNMACEWLKDWLESEDFGILITESSRKSFLKEFKESMEG